MGGTWKEMIGRMIRFRRRPRCVMVMTVEERKCSASAQLSRVSIECVSEDVASSRITILFTPEMRRPIALS